MKQPTVRKSNKVMNRVLQATFFKPHPGQRKILDGYLNNRFCCVVCGRRFGKSKVASTTAIYALLEEDAKVLIVSKTYKLAKKVWNYVIPDIQRIFKDKVTINKSDKIATTLWGSTIEMGSSDNPDSLLGDGYDLVIIDESATISEKIYQQNILPMIRDRKGSIILISTPRGYNWMYDRYMDGQNKIDGWWSYQGSSFENTYVYDEEEKALVRKQSSKLYYEQEYLALFRSFANQVYSDFNRETHIIDRSNLPKDFDSWHKYVAIDPAFNGTGAMLWVGYNEHTQAMIVYDEVVEKGMKHSRYLKELKDREPEGGYAGIIADVASKQKTGETGRSFKSFLLQQEWFVNNGYYISTRRYRIQHGLNLVRGKLLNANGEISLKVLDKCKRTIGDFEGYAYKEGKEDENPDKDNTHDHTMDSLRYLVEYLNKSSVTYEHQDL